MTRPLREDLDGEESSSTWSNIILVIVIVVAFFIGGSTFWYIRGLDHGLYSHVDALLRMPQRPVEDIQARLIEIGAVLETLPVHLRSVIRPLHQRRLLTFRVA